MIKYLTTIFILFLFTSFSCMLAAKIMEGNPIETLKLVSGLFCLIGFVGLVFTALYSIR